MVQVLLQVCIHCLLFICPDIVTPMGIFLCSVRICFCVGKLTESFVRHQQVGNNLSNFLEFGFRGFLRIA